MPRQSFGLNNLQSSFLCSCDSGACGTGEPVCHRCGPWGAAAAAGDAAGWASPSSSTAVIRTSPWAGCAAVQYFPLCS